MEAGVPFRSNISTAWSVFHGSESERLTKHPGARPVQSVHRMVSDACDNVNILRKTLRRYAADDTVVGVFCLSETRYATVNNASGPRPLSPLSVRADFGTESLGRCPPPFSLHHIISCTHKAGSWALVRGREAVMTGKHGSGPAQPLQTRPDLYMRLRSRSALFEPSIYGSL